jgi:hypothetical protein
MLSIGIFHLVRAANGIEPLLRFLASYEKNRGGIAHDLVVILKGFNDERGQPRMELPCDYEGALSSYTHKRFFVPDVGYDIRPYFVAAASFDYERVCFLNSYSVIRDELWLEKMYRHTIEGDVGLVGATGSYQSIYTDSISPPRGPDGRSVVEIYGGATLGKYGLLGKAARRVKHQVATWRMKRYFDPFPNYHIRTNAFMVPRDLMMRVKCWEIASKMDAYRFESGKMSMTRQILSMGRRALVVGKDGRAFEREEWANSNTFWQEDQRNLLVADGQTEVYAKGDQTVRWLHARYAWADQARPL